jgi:hypothetical protein
VPANYIAKWNGGAWSALGSGMNSYVYALAMVGTDLYAGGTFATAGEVAASRIAKWDGGAWSALGSGMNNTVSALAVRGTDLYAGGSFTTAGEVPANYIAKWNGNAWSALGTGMNGTVSALGVSGTNLYAGGTFTTAGGVTVNRIAKWNGSAWSALGSGMDREVRALAADACGHLFVGGSFGLAGTTVSPFIAQANIGGGVTGGRFDSLVYSPVTGFRLVFEDATIGQSYRIQTCCLSPAGTNWVDFIGFTYTGPLVITDASATATARKLFRAVTP